MDINYLFLRQQVERSRADAAASEPARRAHDQLANEYERLIEGVTRGRISFARQEQARPMEARAFARRIGRN